MKPKNRKPIRKPITKTHRFIDLDTKMEAPQAKKRNKILTDAEIEEKKQKLTNSNTTKQEERADRAFRKLLEECGVESTEYWLYTEPELDYYLGKFYFGARKDIDSDDEQMQGLSALEKDVKRKYSANSMQSFRYALNRNLHKKGHSFDITSKTCMSFTKSNELFSKALKELKEDGLAEVKSYPEIEESGNKTVQFDRIFMQKLKK